MAGKFRWISPPTCEGGGFGESLTHQTIHTPGPAPEGGLIRARKTSWPLGTSHPGRCSIDSPSGLRLAQSLSAQSYPHSREQQGQESGG